MRSTAVMLTALLTGTACEGGAALALDGRVTAKDLDLKATAALIEKGKIRTGLDLERVVNSDEIDHLDVDKDGKRDPIKVMEKRDGERHVFELRAIPSGEKKRKPDEVAVLVAVVEVVPAEDDDAEEATVTIRFVEGVPEAPPPITVVVPVVVGSFCHWVLVVDRPIFIGVTYVVIVETHHHKHKKHKHKKHKKY